jgi:aliphatic nitrilase
MDLQASVDKTVHLIEEAAKVGAQLVAFPEDWIPGYPWYIWLGSPAWCFNSGLVSRYFDNAFSYDGPAAKAISDAARKNQIVVSVGVAERSGGSLYIGNWIIGADGETILRRRKLKPTHMERTVFGEGDGSDLAVKDSPLGRLGVLACWEHLQPLSKYAMYSQDEQVHIAAWPGFSLYRGVAYSLGHEVSMAATQTYALEGGCFVLAPSSVTSPEMQELMCQTDEQRDLLQLGGGYSTAFGPVGEPLVEYRPDTWEGIIPVEIDLGLISLAKAAADPAGHYARPDAVRLLIDRSRSTPVVESSQAMSPVLEPEESSGQTPLPLVTYRDPQRIATGESASVPEEQR